MVGRKGRVEVYCIISRLVSYPSLGSNVSDVVVANSICSSKDTT